jgi:hypothetical protein
MLYLATRRLTTEKGIILSNRSMNLKSYTGLSYKYLKHHAYGNIWSLKGEVSGQIGVLRNKKMLWFIQATYRAVKYGNCDLLVMLLWLWDK